MQSDRSRPAPAPRPSRVSLGLGPCVTLVLFVGAACRGDLSDAPPVHLNPNMDNQERYDPQEPNPFFSDGRAMRPEVPGTIPVGGLREDDHFFRGRVDGRFASRLPLPLTRPLLERGRRRFDIYCRACHGGAGMGDGVIIKRGMLPPPSFHDDRIRAMAVGQIFDTLSRGVRNMVSYAAQIPVGDRWAIVAYIRALQLSRSASREEIPADSASSKGWTP